MKALWNKIRFLSILFPGLPMQEGTLEDEKVAQSILVREKTAFNVHIPPVLDEELLFGGGSEAQGQLEGVIVLFIFLFHACHFSFTSLFIIVSQRKHEGGGEVVGKVGFQAEKGVYFFRGAGGAVIVIVRVEFNAGNKVKVKIAKAFGEGGFSFKGPTIFSEVQGPVCVIIAKRCLKPLGKGYPEFIIRIVDGPDSEEYGGIHEA